jgi:methionyl-tRNA formyltransferase
VERPRAVFFGSGAFAVPVLEALATAPDVALVGVVSTPPRPSGRRAAPATTPVARVAASLGCPLLLPNRLREPAAVDAIAALQPAVGVLSDFGRIVPPAILDRFPHWILNLHPSLLPRHRGASPIPAAILAGDTETGVTLFRMDAGMDTGPVVAVDRVALSGDEDAPGLEDRLAAVAARLLRGSLGPWLRGDLEAVPQSDAGATTTRLLGREDGRLDPSLPAAILERHVRAYRPWPGTWIVTAAGRVAVLRAGLGPAGTAGAEAAPGGAGAAGGAAIDAGSAGAAGQLPPGSIVADGPGLALVAGDGRLLRLLEVQPAGGRAMDGAAFRRGRPAIVGTTAG